MSKDLPTLHSIGDHERMVLDARAAVHAHGIVVKDALDKLRILRAKQDEAERAFALRVQEFQRDTPRAQAEHAIERALAIAAE